MTPELHLIDLFEDLEQQAAALDAEARTQTVAEVARAQYAEVDLVSRLHASCGRTVVVTSEGGDRLAGELARIGSDFLMVRTARRARVVPLARVATVTGLSERSVAEPARSVQARLSIRSLLRRFGEVGSPVAVDTGGGGLSGRVRRVGGDFFELDTSAPGTGGRAEAVLVSLASVHSLEVER